MILGRGRRRVLWQSNEVMTGGGIMVSDEGGGRPTIAAPSR